jgi:galactose mutarotase-like enzyme
LGQTAKDSGSFLFGGGRSPFVLKLSEDQKDNSAYFYDLNAKLSYKLDPNNNLYLSDIFAEMF